MKNTCKIVWSKRAQHSLEKIIKYLEENWTENEIQHFALKLERCISILETNPEAFPTTLYLMHLDYSIFGCVCLISTYPQFDQFKN